MARQGQVIPLIAIALPVLIGMAGVSLTVGTVYFAQAKLQNAVDSAALAGAKEMTTQDANAPGDQTTLVTQDDAAATQVSVVSQTTPPGTVLATATATVPGTFAAIFGYKTFTIHAQAVAQYGPGPAFDYAIFQGSNSTPLTFNGGGNHVTGSIHSNNGIVFSGGGNKVTGAVDASGAVTQNGGGNSFGQVLQNQASIGMPQWTVPQLSPSNSTVVQGPYTITGTVNGNIIVDGNATIGGGVTINGSIETIGGSLTFKGGGDTVTGNVTTNGGSVTFDGGGNVIDGYLIAVGGNIKNNGGGVSFGNPSGILTVAAFSQNGVGGSITWNGGGNAETGVVYAPDGTITFNGGGNSFTGSIVGDQVTFNGGGSPVVWKQSALQNIPDQQVALIQ
jgi:hypothetical protein